jgi:hypothetical protein
MSHFVTLVMGHEPEVRLAPYGEDNYRVFVDEEDNYLEEFKTRMIPVVVFADGSRCTKFDNKVDRCWKRKGISVSSQDEFIVPEGAKLVEIPAQEYYESFEEYMADWCGYRERDSVHKRYGIYQNPQSKWDWYSLGGRYDGWLILKDGIKDDPIIKRGQKENTANVALFKHIDFDKTSVPFAILKDWQWHERGNMGWWGAVSNEKERHDWELEYRKLLTGTYENELVSVYDLHT